MNGELLFAFFSGCATMLIAGLLTRWFVCECSAEELDNALHERDSARSLSDKLYEQLGRASDELDAAESRILDLDAARVKTEALHGEAAALARTEIERLNQLLSELSAQPEVDVPAITECIPQIDPDTLQMYEKAYGQWTRFKPYLKRIKGHVNQVLAAYNKDVDQYNESVKKGIKPRKWAGQQTPVTRIHPFK